MPGERGVCLSGPEPERNSRPHPMLLARCLRTSRHSSRIFEQKEELLFCIDELSLFDLFMISKLGFLELTSFDVQMLEWLDGEIDRFSDELPPLRQFILPVRCLSSQINFSDKEKPFI